MIKLECIDVYYLVRYKNRIVRKEHNFHVYKNKLSLHIDK